MKNYKWGVELEMFIPYDKQEAFLTKVKNELKMLVSGDGSINAPGGMCGIEIKTRPLSYAKMQEVLPRLEAVCVEFQAGVNKSTGYHIHASNKSFFNTKKMRHILLTWLAVEDVLFATQPESRLNNRYCQRRLLDLVKKNGLPELPPEEEKDRLVDYLAREDRYYALNISSMARHGTLEVRMHSGTTDAKKIMNWITLMRAIYEYATGSWNGKGSIVKSLLAEEISEEKINRVWDMLGLDAELKEYFNGRVQKFLLPRLAKQTEVAKKIMKMNTTFMRVEKRMKKMRTEYDNMSNRRNRMMQEFTNAL